MSFKKTVITFVMLALLCSQLISSTLVWLRTLAVISSLQPSFSCFF